MPAFFYVGDKGDFSKRNHAFYVQRPFTSGILQQNSKKFGTLCVNKIRADKHFSKFWRFSCR